MKLMDEGQARAHEGDAEFDRLVEQERALLSRAVCDAIVRALNPFRLFNSSAATVPLKAGN